MKNSVWNRITVCLFAAALLAVPAYWLLAPKADFSASERRYLAELPDLGKQNPAQWTWDDDFEAYLADHLPLRDAFVGVDAYMELLSGRQVGKSVWMDAQGALVEAPAAYDSKEIEKRLNRIERLAESTGLRTYVLAIPGNGFVRREKLPPSLARLYRDAEALEQIAAHPGYTPVPIVQRFEAEGQDWYYRTDHHWTGDGAFAAYEQFMQTSGRAALTRDDFFRRTVAGYTGSTRSRSALWLTAADTLQIDEPIDVPVSVTFSDEEAVYDSLFFEEHLSEYDWYPLFLDGNHPVTVIENRTGAAQGTLLMVKDSFGNTLAPLLVPSFGRIVMVDPRYYRGAVSELAAAYEADELLFCYSLERLCTDLNLLRLQ